MYIATRFQEIQKSRCFRIENSGICFWNVRVLLFPVVPDVLHVIVVFHDVQQLLHQSDVLFGLQLLIVLGNHFDLGGNEGKNRGILNFLMQCHIRWHY